MNAKMTVRDKAAEVCDLIAVVSAEWRVPYDKVERQQAPRMDQVAAVARAVAIWGAVNRLGLTHEKAASAFELVSPSSVAKACGRVCEWMRGSEEFRARVLRVCDGTGRNDQEHAPK